jgi:cellulose synthase/poly-beta-1,6-N-acetylglucosamine synthase-like glycosyltransferase
MGFDKIVDFKITDISSKTKFSIVVPFRNEGENLPNLIASFQNLNFPTSNFEVILIDDGSDSPYAIPIVNFEIQIIQNTRQSNSPKKDAIETAINVAKNPWIVATDADCVVGQDYLKVLDQFIQCNKVEMVVGAVKYESNNNFLHEFQCLDIASLQGVTIGSFGNANAFMCNGANFAYTKNLFEALNGFEGNNQIASGDDVFLLQKALFQQAEKVGYLKFFEHIVTTKPADSWRSLFYQRVRWASKAVAYKTFYPKFLGVVTLAANLVTVILLMSLFLDFQIGLFLLILFKIFIDAILIIKANRFLKSKTRFLLAGSLVYPFFVISVGFYSLFGKYIWKGRRF